MSTIEITISVTSATRKPTSLRPIIVHGDETDIDYAVRDALETAGYEQCATCDEWYRSEETRELQQVSYTTRHCATCYEEACQPHPRDCRCEDCKGAREYADELKHDARRDER